VRRLHTFSNSMGAISWPIGKWSWTPPSSLRRRSFTDECISGPPALRSLLLALVTPLGQAHRRCLIYKIRILLWSLLEGRGDVEDFDSRLPNLAPDLRARALRSADARPGSQHRSASLQQEDQHSDPRNGVTENVDTLRAQGQSSAHRDWANERRGCAPFTDGDDRPRFRTDYSDIVPKALKNRSSWPAPVLTRLGQCFRSDSKTARKRPDTPTGLLFSPFMVGLNPAGPQNCQNEYSGVVQPRQRG